MNKHDIEIIKEKIRQINRKLNRGDYDPVIFLVATAVTAAGAIVALMMSIS